MSFISLNAPVGFLLSRYQKEVHILFKKPSVSVEGEGPQTFWISFLLPFRKPEKKLDPPSKTAAYSAHVLRLTGKPRGPEPFLGLS